MLAAEYRLLGGSTLRTGSPALDHPRKVPAYTGRAVKTTLINEEILAVDACWGKERVSFLLRGAVTG